ncbi:MAG: YggT family protein [Chloroflexi bacterium]|nr:YggT family protein [Chloroflexota bacterium]
MAAAFAANFLRFVLVALELAIIGRILLSWVEPRGRSSVAQFLVTLTEPVLAPVRRVLPATGGLDFAPFIIVILIGTIVRMLP